MLYEVITVSEVAHNILRHAGKGTIQFDIVSRAERRGLRVVARDNGPGIADIRLAMKRNNFV